MPYSTALQAQHSFLTANYLLAVKSRYACAYLVPFQLLRGVAVQQLPGLVP